jgi:hypothetical protein
VTTGISYQANATLALQQDIGIGKGLVYGVSIMPTFWVKPGIRNHAIQQSMIVHFKRKEIKMSDKTEINGKFRFDQDSKRFHRFQIETEIGIVGTVYIPKDMGGEKLPKKITLEYANKNS